MYDLGSITVALCMNNGHKIFYTQNVCTLLNAKKKEKIDERYTEIHIAFTFESIYLGCTFIFIFAYLFTKR